MSQSSAPARLPKDRSPRDSFAPGSGPSPVRLQSFRVTSPTAATRPEMPVVRIDDLTTPPPPLSRPEISVIPQPSSRASWHDATPSDPITETSGRATDFGPPPSLDGMRDRALLLRMDGVLAGQVVSLSDGDVTLGRHSDNSISIDDTGVSRFHAKIIKDGPTKHVLVDLGARNGTVVQGTRITSHTLSDGDFIQLGPRVSFRFTFTDKKQERILHQLYESSTRDALTSAYNRRHFDERLLSEIAYAARHEAPAGLLLLDIDHFKKVNDTFGHSAGDAVLRQVAGIVRSRLRTEDVFARIGGEEFAVILRGVPLIGCARLAERLRTSVAASPVLYEGRMIPVTMSLGCATLACSGTLNPDRLLKLADERLYRAKASGRNRVAIA